MGDFAGHPFRGNQYQSGRFTDYNEARTNAGIMSKVHNLDVAIRGVKEYGKKGFNISFASRNDSDYALAEIVKPGDPHWTKESPKQEDSAAAVAKASGYSGAARDLSPAPVLAKATNADDWKSGLALQNWLDKEASTPEERRSMEAFAGSGMGKESVLYARDKDREAVKAREGKPRWGSPAHEKEVQQERDRRASKRNAAARGRRDAYKSLGMKKGKYGGYE
jgi:hypothetical protein